MDKRLIDRWTETTLFVIAVAFSGVLLVPVLGLGVIVSCTMLIAAATGSPANLAGAVIVLLSAGGAAGIVGLLRARRGVANPGEHNVGATLVCLVVGTATAFAVAAIPTVALTVASRGPLELPGDSWVPLLFLAAPVVWVLFGIGWMQRLLRRFAEDTGHAFDGTPVVMLCVTITLVVATVLRSTAL